VILVWQIAVMDEAIDRLVYDLTPSGMIHGFSTEEIEIVERE
jgi:hypothetical protein